MLAYLRNVVGEQRLGGFLLFQQNISGIFNALIIIQIEYFTKLFARLPFARTHQIQEDNVWMIAKLDRIYRSIRNDNTFVQIDDWKLVFDDTAIVKIKEILCVSTFLEFRFLVDVILGTEFLRWNCCVRRADTIVFPFTAVIGIVFFFRAFFKVCCTRAKRCSMNVNDNFIG